jgi:hypothetical protein
MDKRLVAAERRDNLFVAAVALVLTDTLGLLKKVSLHLIILIVNCCYTLPCTSGR